MKRIIIISLLIMSMLLCLPSCDLFGGDKPIEENPEFAKLNALFESNFENYTITVDTTSPDGHELNDKYVVTTVNGTKSVNYRTETLNSFVIDGNIISMPNGYKTVNEGTCNATEINASSNKSFDINVPKFQFSYKYINNDTIIPGRVVAKVKSLDGFMGLNIQPKEAKFALQYSDNAPVSMQITYVTQSGNTVVITYTFN